MKILRKIAGILAALMLLLVLFAQVAASAQKYGWDSALFAMGFFVVLFGLIAFAASGD